MLFRTQFIHIIGCQLNQPFSFILIGVGLLFEPYIITVLWNLGTV